VPSDSTHAVGEAYERTGVAVISMGVNESDDGTRYDAESLFDADSTLIQRRWDLRLIMTD
jgi:hypothetical protein